MPSDRTPRVAFLTLEDTADYVIDDALAIAELTRRGWYAVELPWSRTDIEWSHFDIVIIRTTWDYQNRPADFLDTLRRIEASGAHLENPRSVVEWNLDKSYLRALADLGVPIVPSVWGRGGTPSDFGALFHTLGETEIVIKPTISGGAQDTFRLQSPIADDTLRELVHTFRDRDWLAQPFVRSVLTEGEYSLFYFDGKLSHAIQKVPTRGDFRVQEEHGGEIEAIPASPDLRRVADVVLSAIAPVPFQARIDLIRLDDGSLALIEAELIEPSLYLRMDAGAPGRFADAVEAVMARRVSR